VVDGVSDARFRVALGGQDLDVAEVGRAVAHRIDAALELRALAADVAEQPGKRLIRIGTGLRRCM